jgi:sugar O-acyltransferase (sialic acid O-acetyltransferase NeuD family)
VTRPSIILIGAGGHAKSCIDVLEAQAQFTIAGLVGMPDELGREVLGYSVIGTDQDLRRLLSSHPYALIAIGQLKYPINRIQAFSRVVELGYRTPTVVAPSAYVSFHAALGEGSIVMNGAVINAGAKVGANCIINTGAIIDHDAVVGDHAHISTASVLNGDVSVGRGSFIGSNASVKHGVKIGSYCVVGMGLTVLNDLTDHTILKRTDR